jgi:hypothetical protein
MALYAVLRDRCTAALARNQARGIHLFEMGTCKMIIAA